MRVFSQASATFLLLTSLLFSQVAAEHLNARVKITSGDLVQTGQVLSGGSYLSQSDLRIHFGLGNQDHVDKVEIRWLGGTTEILTNLTADHYYRVKEGKGIVSSLHDPV
jgi:hypothetical protein